MTCKFCMGTGSIPVELGTSLRYACPDCRGSGRLPDDNQPDPFDDSDDGEPEDEL